VYLSALVKRKENLTMAEEDRAEGGPSVVGEDRRRFLKRAGTMAAAAPAAALLLSASSKQAMAENPYNNGRWGTSSPGGSAPHENGIGGSS
jgi:hypothetical protein